MDELPHRLSDEEILALTGGPPCPIRPLRQDEVGKLLGLSQARIQQIESLALEKLARRNPILRRLHFEMD